MSRKKQLTLAVAVLLLLPVALVWIAAMIEDRLIYYPDSVVVTTPERLGLAHEEVELATADSGTVHGYYLFPEGEPRAHLLFSHGNAGNITGRLFVAEELVDRGMAVLLYDYRGYGKSPGTPSEDGLYHDAEAAFAWLCERAGSPDRVVLYGRSLGGGVSWEMAARHPEAAGIITDATFTSVPDMASRMFPLPFVGKLVRTRMDNRRRVAEVALPKLLLHGTEDELIPFAMGRELHERAAPPVEFVPIPGAGHNDTMLPDPGLYYGAIEQFVAEWVEGGEPRRDREGRPAL